MKQGQPSKWLAAFCAGLLQTAAFAPSPAWWLQLLSLAMLAALSWQAAPRSAAALGALFGIGWLTSGLWWLFISMHQFGHIPAVPAGLAVLLLAIFLSGYYAAALALWARLSGGMNPGWKIFSFACCWLLAELARATFFGGFPWIASGYAHSVGPLAAWAPWIGVYGICAIAAAIAASGVALTASRQWQHAAWPVLLLGLGALLPQEFTSSSGRLQVSLLQPNVRQDEKFDRSLMDANLDLLAQQIEAARGQLVVTPESVVPLPLDYLSPDYLQRIRQAAAQRPLLLGIFLGDETSGYVNSLVSFGSAAPYSYGKRHLLPFGEFIPPGFHWFARAMNIPLDDQARGQHQRAFAVAGQRLRPLICYEDLFGEDFVDSMTGHDAATVLINVSNLAWFGTLMVQDQHLQFSQMRALEFQRPFIRATNTGATAVIDHRGQVLVKAAPAMRTLLEAEVEGRKGSTPYARWLQAFGLWPLWLLIVAGLALTLARRRAS